MCSIFGTNISLKDYPFLMPLLGIQGEERGTDATGIAIKDGEEFSIHKEDVSASNFNWGELPSKSDFLLGHTRKTTQGSEKKNYNNHPFIDDHNEIVLAHNGVINNDKELKKVWELDDTEIKTDSYVIVQMLETVQFLYKADYNELTTEMVTEVIELLRGSFALSILTKNKLFLLRHKNPLNIAYNGKELIYASTEEMINNAIDGLGMKDTINFMGTIVGEIQEDVVYEFDLNLKKFVNKKKFDIPYYAKTKNYKNYNNYSKAGGYNNNYYNNYSSTTNKYSSKNKKNNKKKSENYTTPFKDSVITKKEYMKLNYTQKNTYARCDECGEYYMPGWGGYHKKINKHLCYYCEIELEFDDNLPVEVERKDDNK